MQAAIASRLIFREVSTFWSCIISVSSCANGSVGDVSLTVGIPKMSSFRWYRQNANAQPFNGELTILLGNARVQTTKIRIPPSAKPPVSSLKQCDMACLPYTAWWHPSVFHLFYPRFRNHFHDSRDIVDFLLDLVPLIVAESLVLPFGYVLIPRRLPSPRPYPSHPFAITSVWSGL